MELLLATHNPGKLGEMKSGFPGLVKKGWRLFSPVDFQITKEPEETGKTFKDNALLKARYYAKKTQMPTVADDGGFVIPYLNGEPGVHSARWLGEGANETQLVEHALWRLKSAKGKQRRAYLELVLCFFDPDKNLMLFENERISGTVADKPSPKRLPGFPYRSLLVLDRFNKYYDDLNKREHLQVNHRLKALRKLQTKLLRYYR